MSGEVLIYIYRDRMEVDNPGEMPKALVRRKSEVLPHISTPRNPLMAEVFFVGDKMEKTGRGMKLIHDKMEELGTRLPEWESRGGRTKLTVWRTAFVRRLNERLESFLKSNKGIVAFTKSEYLAFFKGVISDRTAKNDLALLVQVGRARKEGAGPATRYLLVK